MIVGILAGAVIFCLCAGTLSAPLSVLLGAGLGGGLFLLGRHSHGGVPVMDLYARRSRLSGWNAPLKAGGCAALLLLCVVSPSPLPPLGLGLGLAALAVLAGGISPRDYLSVLSVPAAFLLLSGLALLWEPAPAPQGLLSLPWFQSWLVVTVQTRDTARLVMARALGAVSCLYFLSLSTAMPELLSVLRRLRVPGVVIQLMVLIYRYIFIMLSAFHEMRAAAASRLGYGALGRSLRTTGAVYGNLLAKSFRRAGACFDAMESRCYDGDIRFLEDEPPIGAAQAALFAALVAAMAAAVVWTAG